MSDNFNFEFNELDKQTNVVLLLVNNPNLNMEKPYNFLMCGMKMKDYVKQCFKYANCIEKEINAGEDILDAVKNEKLDNKKYTMILFSDTPLLKRKTILEVLEYMQIKNLSVLKLTRGYVFETEYLKKIDKLYDPQLHYFDEEDFMACVNLKQLSIITEILQNRIISYHMQNGVVFTSPNSCKIDVNCNIEKGTIIENNNVLKGKVIIGNNSHLISNNIIENSVIKNNVTINCSNISNAFIEENCTIKPYCVINNNSYLEKNVVVNEFSFISESLIKQNTVIESYTKLKN